MQLKFLVIILAVSVSALVTACNNTGDNPKAENRDTTSVVVIQNDEIDTADYKDIEDHKVDVSEKEESGNTLPDISGTHDLTLQWISWDRPGKAVIQRTGNNTYTVKGSQTGNGQKLEVDGTLKMITPLELEFDGRIVMSSTTSPDAEPCIREGKQTFLSTKGRKYWRLQNMANCGGGGVVDYIDIYF